MDRVQITDRLALDPGLSSGQRYLGTTETLPIDFSDGLPHDLFSDTIPGGSLGSNGYIELVFGGAYAASAARTVTIGFSSTVTTQSLATGATLGWEGKIMLQNIADEAVQKGIISVVFGRGSASPEGPYLTELSTTVDTATDWTFDPSITLSAAGGMTSGGVSWLRTNLVFIP